MQLKFFTIPVISESDESEMVNKFLRSVKVLEISKELIRVTNGAYWTICISYLPNVVPDSVTSFTKKVDYKEVLNDSAFQKFSLLRKIRKQIADTDAVPAYAVFTDFELSEIAQAESIDVTSMKQVKGIGQKKLEKYGQRLCELFSMIDRNEAGGQSD